MRNSKSKSDGVASANPRRRNVDTLSQTRSKTPIQLHNVTQQSLQSSVTASLPPSSSLPPSLPQSQEASSQPGLTQALLAPINFLRPPKMSQDGTFEPNDDSENEQSFQLGNEIDAAGYYFYEQTQDNEPTPEIVIVSGPEEGRLHSSPDEWEDVPPDFVLSRLKLIKDKDFGTNEKCFYKTYTNWSKLDASQRDKSFLWFKKLTLPVQGQQMT